MERTFYDYLQKENPELMQTLINLGLKEDVCNLAERYAIDEEIKEIKNQKK